VCWAAACESARPSSFCGTLDCENQGQSIALAPATSPSAASPSRRPAPADSFTLLHPLATLASCACAAAMA
jgi:hypothetical protein